MNGTEGVHMQAEKFVVYALLVLKAFIYGLSVLWLGRLLHNIGSLMC